MRIYIHRVIVVIVYTAFALIELRLCVRAVRLRPVGQLDVAELSTAYISQ